MELADNLSEYLDVELWIKRDDCTGLAGGGNKSRKLEYLLADAQSKGADTLVTLGGIQSNHARQTAAAAAKLGFSCELVLQEVAGVASNQYNKNGNFLLDQLLGATIHWLSEQDCLETFTDRLISQLQAAGKKLYLIPIGGSNVIGSLGYVQCAFELLSQVNALSANQKTPVSFDHLLLASGSAGTQAGLLAGLIASQQTFNVLGINVSRPEQEQNQLVLNLLLQIIDYLKLTPSPQISDNLPGLVNTNGNYYGEGYGIPTVGMLNAVKTCARLQGLLLDPVYSGKAMAGLFDLCQKKVIAPGSRVLFLHTGGSPGLFAYQDVLEPTDLTNG